MAELFKTFLVLSAFGFILTAIMLAVKPLTSKKFPASWQYYMWISVMLSMLIPVYKIIPSKEIYKLPVIPQITTEVEVSFEEEANDAETAPATEAQPGRESGIKQIRIGLFRLSAVIWLSGVGIYLLLVFSSYISYISKKRKLSFPMPYNALLNEVARSLKIKRKIKVRIFKSSDSPMLVGIFFPIIYIPDENISDEKLKMIFLHELTHYKRKDLVFKWLSVFVNAIHWFNPLSYFLCYNLSEACEISCDMAVTKNMTEDEQKLYMQTILDLAKRR